MNRIGSDVNWQGAAADSTFDPAGANLLELDPREWHEFWITIEAAEDTAGGVTHTVNIYLDGATEPNTFGVTAGSGSDFDGAYIAMGCGATPQSGAYDIDFYAYKAGIHIPSGGSAVESESIKPGTYTLAQNYPNPFNPNTTIEYTLAKPGDVMLTMYDLLGREVNRVVNEFQSAGSYKIQVNAGHFENYRK